jgi:hypothetical protein
MQIGQLGVQGYYSFTFEVITFTMHINQSPQVPKRWGPLAGVLLVLLGGAQVVCLRDMLILNEIWAEDKIYIYIYW